MSETQTRLTREDVAKIEIGNTDVSRGMVLTLFCLFILVIFLVPAVQMLREEGKPGALEIVNLPVNAARVFAESEGSLFSRMMSANRTMLADIQSYEDGLEEASFLTEMLVPPVQQFMARYLGTGNETAYIGRDRWLFYRPGLDYLTSAGFLDPTRLARRAAAGSEWQPAPQPDPLKAIVDFRDQLAEREIELVLVPVPVKPGVHPERFSSRYEDSREDVPLHNRSFDEFLEALRQDGVLVCSLDEVMTSTREESPLYLATDTHWRPETMAAAARRLGDFVNENVTLPPAPEPGYKLNDDTIAGQGDIARMMRLPENQTLFGTEIVEIQQVLTAGDDYWNPSRSADVLLLGDSFSNIYSLESMEWGVSAGLAEHLSYVLQRPLDAMIRNDAGAYATREALSRDLARGKDRLEGKRLVIWEFAERELAVGDWKLLDMALGSPPPARFITPEDGQTMVLTGVIEAASRAPRPGSVPYKDHVIAVHLRDLETADGPIEGGEALVYMASMRDNVWTPAARLRERERITVRLNSWYDVAAEYDAINRAELGDESLQFEDPCWGELVEPKM